MKTNTIGFIGGGRITRIFLQAFKNKSIKFDSIFVCDPNEDVLENLHHEFPQVTGADASHCAKQDLVVLAIHPPEIVGILETIKDALSGDSIVLSLAPKITISKMGELLPTRNIVRMIPNATSFINKGLNPVHFHDSFSDEEKNEFMKAFSALGNNFEVTEQKLEGYAIVSAMLPTYFWFQWEKMEEIAVKTGLDDREAKEIIRDSLTYAIDLFYRSGMDHDEVIDLIPVKPIGDYEEEINSIYEIKLMGLFRKIGKMPATELL